MEDIIQTVGKRIFVTKRVGSSLEEFIEIMELNFCLERNLALGSRAISASVKLGDLTKIQQVASQLNTPDVQPNTDGLDLPVLPGQATVAGQSIEVNQSEKEAKFIDSYDEYFKKVGLLSGGNTDGLRRSRKGDKRRTKPLKDPRTINHI